MQYTHESTIQTLAELRAFADHLWIDCDLNFNIDTPFQQYTDDDGNPRFTEQEAEIYNRLMEDCFFVCEREKVDIYQLFQYLELLD